MCIGNQKLFESKNQVENILYIICIYYYIIIMKEEEEEEEGGDL